MNYDNLKDAIKKDIADTINNLRGLLMSDVSELLVNIGEYQDGQFAQVKPYLDTFADMYSAGTTLVADQGYVSLMPHYDALGRIDGILNLAYEPGTVFSMDAYLAVSISKWFRGKYTEQEFVDLCTDLEIEGEENLFRTVYQLHDINDYDGDGSDMEIVYTQLFQSYFKDSAEFVTNFVVSYSADDFIVKIDNEAEKILTQNAIVKDFNGEDLSLSNVINSLADSLQVQQSLMMFLEVSEMPNATIDKLSALLFSSVNSYSDNASDAIRQIIASIDNDGPSGILNAVASIYYNMSKTSVDEDGKISFYSNDYVTRTCWSSVTNALMTAIPMIVSTFVTVINPVAGMIVTGIYYLGQGIYNTLHAKTVIKVDDKAINACVGYPLYQRMIQHDDPSIQNTPFYTIVKDNKIIVVNTPVIKYSAWIDGENNVYVECFLNIDFNAEDLRTLLSSMGFRFTQNTAYDLNASKTMTYTASSLWRKLNELTYPHAYLTNSDDDQINVVKYVYALSMLLSNNLNANVNRIYQQGNNQLPGYYATDIYQTDHIVTVAESLATIVANSPLNSWQSLGVFFRDKVNKDIDPATFTTDYEHLIYAYNWSYTHDIPSEFLSLLDNWYNYADQDFHPGYGSPLTYTTGLFWDRDHMYVVPPSWTSTSVWMALIITGITIAAVTAGAIAFKKAVRTRLGKKYNAITAEYAAAQDAYKEGNTALGDELIKKAQKSTKRYNRIAGLLGASTLSYTSGWENGDASPVNPIESLSSIIPETGTDADQAVANNNNDTLTRIGKLISTDFI